jgi:precorrin-6A/cobalt-precorrin-6A reductase
MTRILLLGGTSEASQMAQALAEAGAEATYSYAGRTERPMAQPLPTRVGGFGGADGMAEWIREHRISHVIDATHPFAARISRNAIAACAATGAELMALERAPWVAGAGDRWFHVPDIGSAVAALPDFPARVFLAIGRQNVAPFAARSQHFYLLRLVDDPLEPLPLPKAEAVIARGPFTVEGDIALLKKHRIDWVVAKNAGGSGARAKLDAARALGLPVVMIDRPALPPRPVMRCVAEVMDWLAHSTRLGV